MYIGIIEVKSKNKRLMVVKESYRDKVSKKSRQRKIRDIGYIEDFLDLYKDPLQHFKDELKAEQNNIKTIQPSKSINIDPNAKIAVRDINTPRTESILKSIKAANGSLITGNLYNFNYVDEILLEIQKKFEITLDRQFLTIGEIKKIIAKTKKKT